MLFEEMGTKAMTKKKREARLKDLPRNISDSFYDGYSRSESFSNVLRETIDMFLDENLDILHSFYLYRTALLLVLTEFGDYKFHVSKKAWDETQVLSEIKQRMNIAVGNVTDDGVDLVVSFVGKDAD